jgi:hypothetical protein
VVRLTILSGRSLPAYSELAKTDHPCSKLQGILAKPNKNIPEKIIDAIWKQKGGSRKSAHDIR